VPEKPIQTDTLDRETRNKLWSIFYHVTIEPNVHEEYGFRYADPRLEGFCKIIWVSFYDEAVDDYPGDEETCRRIKKIFFNAEANTVFDFLQVWLDRFEIHAAEPEALPVVLNEFLENLNCGVRVIDGKFSRVTGPIEVQSLEESFQLQLPEVSNLLKKAHNALNQRPVPDVENAVKDGVIALELACKLLTETNASGIEIPLTKLAQKSGMHPALKAAIGNLYGYSSQISGARHGTLNSEKVTPAEAKLVLVLASGIANFLVEEGARTGLIQTPPPP
jgi:AbiJ N-terminal domain 4